MCNFFNTVMCRGMLPRARGMPAYVRDGYGAFRQPKFECGCCEMLVVRVCGLRQNFTVYSLYCNTISKLWCHVMVTMLELWCHVLVMMRKLCCHMLVTMCKFWCHVLVTIHKFWILHKSIYLQRLAGLSHA